MFALPQLTCLHHLRCSIPGRLNLPGHHSGGLEPHTQHLHASHIHSVAAHGPKLRQPSKPRGGKSLHRRSNSIQQVSRGLGTVCIMQTQSRALGLVCEDAVLLWSCLDCPACCYDRNPHSCQHSRRKGKTLCCQCVSVPILNDG